jgi:hypothetical protein
MKLLGVVKNIILERRQLLDKYEVDGVLVDIFYNDHSNMAINTSMYGRKPIQEILTSMVELLDVIVKVSLDILSKPKKRVDKDRSILVIDNLIGIDYHFWVTQSKSGKLFLTINTSIGHPKFLPKDKNEKKIIITKTGDTIITEQFDINNFTKIVKGDIIIYYE